MGVFGLTLLVLRSKGSSGLAGEVVEDLERSNGASL